MIGEATMRTRAMPSSLNAMEGPICDIARVGRILMHLTETANQIEGEEMAWIGMQLVRMGTTLEKLFYAVHQECGGSGRGGNQNED